VCLMIVESGCSIPVKELFAAFGSRDKSFAVFTGYIDDSGSDESRLFTLACLVGEGKQWTWVERAWLNCLEKKNSELRAQGRKELSRYKASDCSTFNGEFKGWTQQEQIALQASLIKIFMLHPLAIFAFTLDLRDLVAVFPEASNNPYPLANVVVLTYLILETAMHVLGRYPEHKLLLIHDRGKYDAVLLEAFNHVRDTSRYKDRLVSLAPMGWEDCVPLQPADFLAYENYKAVERETAGYKRRKTLELLLDLRSFGGSGIKIERQAIQDLRDSLNDESKRILFENARIRHV
jgi:hypothetical protein